MPGPSERVTSSWGALAGLNVLKRINPTALPWAASGLPLRGGNAPIIIESWYKSWSATDRAGRLPVNLAPVSHLDHDDHQLRVLNRVDDPVISLTNSVVFLA